MALRHHPLGGYGFLPGIAPYSRGVVSLPGSEIVHVTIDSPVPYREGFARIERHLSGEGRPRAALCGIELRSSRPFSFAGFAEFNAGYTGILEQWGVFVEGMNPVARTNVAPEVAPPAEPTLYGFSYTRPCDGSLPPTFVVAGAGELPEGLLTAGAIVRAGDTSPEGLRDKARCVMDLMENRLRDLGAGWSAVTAIDVYTVHPLHHLMPVVILERVGSAAAHGVRWFFSRPPIEGIEYEMDVRGVRGELRLA
jgi:hypothetical protein